ncbi:uncharacterized protein [Rutidosis leptorrhynchoides]|uniref:uncharacterized protein isoform X2 n=1 Tax=Rutidosis leptorrhynchoides TaxID=125765 RepID=UPI003A99A986
MASVTAVSDVTDGPVLTLINKRIRNLKKKLNRITQLEESVAQGKSVIKNKEQKDLLASKPSILAAIDELDKFRQPLSVAVDEEINLAINKTLTNQENNEKEDEDENIIKTETLGNEENEKETMKVDVVDDLLSLIYFGSMFDVKSPSDFNSIMLTRTHERNCCLTYDYVTDDAAAVMLGETDLDLISLMSSMLISRPADSSFSHRDALQKCVEHAKLWIEKSDQPISPNSNVTYAALREKLVKIIGSDYLKITPEMKAPAEVAAEAAGTYTYQLPVGDSANQPEQKEDDVKNFQINGTSGDQSSLTEDHTKHEAETENSKEFPAQMEPTETNAGGAEGKDQYVPRRSYNNQRGGGRNGSTGGSRRGYGSGRGGRSGGRGGPYQNGRNQYNDQQQPGNYYPRNHHHGGSRGRGGVRGNGGGGNGAYNHHGSGGVEAAES